MSASPFSVLLVDDDTDTQQIVRMIMDHYKHPITIAHNADAAFRQLSKSTPDIIMLDIYLPDASGYDTLKVIRATVFEHSPKVVAITAYYTTDTAADMFKHGFDGYCRKPIIASQLIQYLQDVIDQP